LGTLIISLDNRLIFKGQLHFKAIWEHRQHAIEWHPTSDH
jgi:hypothetical protein